MSILAPANFSPCRRYRYTLARDLDPMGLGTGATGAIAAWCGLNPSTADETKSDPTCTREMCFTHDWGYRHYVKVNAYGFRATDPDDMKAAADPVGPDNDAWILAVAERAEIIVLCWGVHAVHQERNTTMLRLLAPFASKLRYLKLTKDGHPQHPLYLAKTLKPLVYPFRP
jgi:hypothetical protein